MSMDREAHSIANSCLRPLFVGRLLDLGTVIGNRGSPKRRGPRFGFPGRSQYTSILILGGCRIVSSRPACSRVPVGDVAAERPGPDGLLLSSPLASGMFGGTGDYHFDDGLATKPGLTLPCSSEMMPTAKITDHGTISFIVTGELSLVS